MLKKPAYILLFIYGLLIPKISALLMIFYGSYKFLSNARRIFHYFIIEIILLTCFLVSYYWISITYGFYTIENLFFFSFLSISSYAFGATIDLKTINILHLFLIFFIGLMIVVSISTYQTYFTGNIDQALEARVVYNMWSGHEENSPVYGAYVLLSMSLLCLIFLKKVSLYEKIIISILVIFSIIVLLAFQSRGPFLSATIIFLVAYFYLKRYQNITLVNIKYLVPVLLVLSVLYFSFENEILSNKLVEGYSKRIEKKGMKSARYEVWMKGLEGLYEEPFGGKAISLKVGSYTAEFVHNMWLDINFKSGIIPLIFILLFIFKHTKYITYLFSKANQNKENIYFIIIGLGILFPTFFEPMMDASFIYISLIAFYLALLKNFYYFKKGIL